MDTELLIRHPTQGRDLLYNRRTHTRKLIVVLGVCVPSNRTREVAILLTSTLRKLSHVYCRAYLCRALVCLYVLAREANSATSQPSDEVVMLPAQRSQGRCIQQTQDKWSTTRQSTTTVDSTPIMRLTITIALQVTQCTRTYDIIGVCVTVIFAAFASWGCDTNSYL